MTSIGVLAPAAGAQAYFVHTVTSGESLYSIAQSDGLSVAQLAAANGLSLSSGLVPGQSVSIPPQSASIAPVSNTVVTVGDGDSDADDGYTSSSSTSSESTASTVSSTVTGGGYLIQPGDTLWGLAARAGVSEASLAAANGLSPSAFLIAGHSLSLTGSASAATTATSVSVAYVPTSTASQEPVGSTAQGDPTGPPYPTPERLSASQVGTIGANNGSTYSLTDAVGWQESGFNNDLVSSADARGIMQILPGTWNWIQHSLAGGTLAPASAVDNVRGGSLMLGWLLRQTGGDPAMAAAGYYQGLSSVQKYGMFHDTQNYVQNVLALRNRFGGG